MSESNNQHARLGPSDSGRWFNCPGAIKATEGIPPSTSDAAEEGTAAHELLERCLLDNVQAIQLRGQVYNGYTMDDEFINHIQPVLNFLRTRAEGGTIIPERRVNPGKWLGRDDCWGTGDVTLMFPTTIEIWDLKYGRGITVEPADNLQLILYAIGVLADLTDEQRSAMSHVTCGIIQPRKWHENGSYRAVTYTMDDIYAWMFKLQLAANRTDDPDAPRIPGDKQCQWCKAKRNCREHSDMIIDELRLPSIQNREVLEAHVVKPVGDLTGQELATILANGDMLKAWVTAVEDYCKEMMLAGNAPEEVVRDFKVVEGRSNTTWIESDKDKIAKQLSNKRLKKAEIFKEVLKTPTQIIEAAEANPDVKPKSVENIKKMTHKPKGKLKVVPRAASGKEVPITIEQHFPDHIQQRAND